jgi:hypothetical protein
MIEVRPLNAAQTVEGRDPLIGTFSDPEWWDLLELTRRYGFDLPHVEIQYPRHYEHPVEIDAETSRSLWEMISAVYNDDVVPYSTTWEERTEPTSEGGVEFPCEEPEETSTSRESAHEHPELHVGKLQVKQLLNCAQIGAEQGGIEIRRVRDE